MKWLINMRVRDGDIIDKCDNTWAWAEKSIQSSGRFGGGGIRISPNCYGHTTNYLEVWAGSPYTVAFWVYITGIQTNRGNILFGGCNFENYKTDGSGPQICPRKGMSDSSAMWIDCATNNCSYFNPTSNYVSSSWRHIAVTRDKNNIMRCFVDGNCVVTLDRNGCTYASNPVYINDGYKYNENSYRHSYGYIDDVCLLSGMALWTKNFTPPTEYLEDYVKRMKPRLFNKDNNMYGIQKQSE